MSDFELKMIAIDLAGLLNLAAGYEKDSQEKSDIVNELRFSFFRGDLNNILGKIRAVVGE